MKIVLVILALIVIAIAVFVALDSDKTQNPEIIVDYLQVRQDLQKKIEVEPENGELYCLLAQTYRKEYFPTYNAGQFLTPLSSNWQNFPADEFSQLKQYESSLDKELEFEAREKCLPELYFHLCYSFNRWKFFSAHEYADKMKKFLPDLLASDNEFKDNAVLWNYYFEDNTIDFDWAKIKSFRSKFPESELIPLVMLQQIFNQPPKASSLQISDYVSQRLKDFYQKYGEFSLIADSLFIYRQIDPRIEHYKQQPEKTRLLLDNIIAQMFSSSINHYCIWAKGETYLQQGKIEMGFQMLSSVMDQNFSRYEREKLYRKMISLALQYKDYGKVISYTQQLNNLSFSESFNLWQAYLKLGYESQADEMYPSLIAAAAVKDKSKIVSIQKKYDLKKLKITDINIVRPNNQVRVFGKISNPTLKEYTQLTVKLTISENETDTQVITFTEPVLYPESDIDFEKSLDYSYKGGDLKAKAELIDAADIK